jgi:hypothetical protein
MQLETLEWAKDLRASLRQEIEVLLASGVTDSFTLEKIVSFRQQVRQAETLVAALEEHFPEAAQANGRAGTAGEV